MDKIEGFANMENRQADGGECRDIRDWISKLLGGMLRLSGLHSTWPSMASKGLPSA